jgi:hypothetical protein
MTESATTANSAIEKACKIMHIIPNVWFSMQAFLCPKTGHRIQCGDGDGVPNRGATLQVTLLDQIFL